MIKGIDFERNDKGRKTRQEHGCRVRRQEMKESARSSRRGEEETESGKMMEKE